MMSNSSSPSPLANSPPLLYPVTAYYIRKLLRQNLDRLYWLEAPSEPLPATICEDLTLLLAQLYPEESTRQEKILTLEQLILTHQTISPQGPKYRLQLAEVEEKIYRLLGFQIEKVKKGTILIVDDTPDNLRLLMVTLSRQGYEVSTAISGFAALETVLTIVPDLVLLDSKMPGMDGYEVCRQLKINPVTQGIPVIFISARDDAGDKVKAFRCGAVDYITKPFQVEEVLARVDHHLQLSNLQQRLTEQNIRLQQEIHRREPKLSHWQQQQKLVIQSWIRDRKFQDLQRQWRIMSAPQIRNQLTLLAAQVHQLQGYQDRLTIAQREQKLEQLLHLIQQTHDQFEDFCQLDHRLDDRALKPEKALVKENGSHPALGIRELQPAGNPQSFDLVRFCHSLIIQVQSSAGRWHQIRFYNRYDRGEDQQQEPEVNPWAYLDQTWLYQLLYNLFAYAAIVTPKGSAIVLELGPSSDGTLLIKHYHSCAAPTPEILELLSRPWHQSIELLRHSDGQGLDLAIARQSADRLNLPLTVVHTESQVEISFSLGVNSRDE